MKELIENVIIIYNNGLRENCEAISITKKGIYTGHIKISGQNNGEFVNHSFIPIDQIKKIVVINESGNFEDIDFIKENKEEQ